MWEEDPHCFWCGCLTALPSPEQNGHHFDNEATLDHLRTRFDDDRQEPCRGGERRIVLSCYRCNWLRGRAREAMVPIEEKRTRAKHHNGEK
jgi:hypothetical protein